MSTNGGLAPPILVEGLVKRFGAFTAVDRVSFGIGVERNFPVNSPNISLIEVLQQGRVRRAKLYYLRGLKGKAARNKRVERVLVPATAAEPKP